MSPDVTALRTAAIAAALLLSAAGCGSSPSVSGPAGSSAAASGAGNAPAVTSTVFAVSDYMFPPLTVAPGTTIRAVDGDDEPHTVTFDDRSFTTVTFDKSHPVTFTAPTRPGSYAFHCKVHPSMHGTIVVRQP